VTASAIHPAIAQDNVAVITGGANGIGLAAAKRFGALGMRICIVDRDAALLESAVSQIPGGAVALNVDVRNRAAVDALAEQVREELGAVSLLMNNAGIAGGGDVMGKAADWDRVLGVNLMGVIHGVQAFVPAMVESQLPGLVINTGSKQGITQPPGQTAYNISKAGVKALTEGLAHTLREKTGDRITAHLLIPGFTYTGMIARHIPEMPPAAWSADQVVDQMVSDVTAGRFYILCQDNETTREQDEKRIMWSVGDIVADRPALSRWHPDYKDAFAAFMAGDD
jgi:NAD(P)-dependent dehydrogenase (short-subunit alcohol dehydrogenase family)